MFHARMPPFWYKGYVHYHTSFRYPSKYRVSPEELIDGMRRLGASFVFCAGDHGCSRGGSWGCTRVGDYPAYREFCLENSASDVILIPCNEQHIHIFDKHQHHTCIPCLEFFSEVYAHNPETLISNVPPPVGRWA